MSGVRYWAYRHLAALLRGSTRAEGSRNTPTVSFTHNGSTVRVGLAPTIAGQPAADSSDPRGRAVQPRHPVPAGAGSRCPPAPAQAPKGTRPVKLGDQEFDRDFVVQANDLEMARDFLGPTVRGAIANLQRSVHPGGMLVSINPERMLVQIDRNLGLEPRITRVRRARDPGTPRRL